MSEAKNEDNPRFGVTCPNFHTSYFDKREVCPASGSVVVRQVVRQDGKVLDRLWLKCKTCGEEIIATVDCEGYK